jgi:hypothetical protein
VRVAFRVFGWTARSVIATSAAAVPMRAASILSWRRVPWRQCAAGCLGAEIERVDRRRRLSATKQRTVRPETPAARSTSTTALPRHGNWDSCRTTVTVTARRM